MNKFFEKGNSLMEERKACIHMSIGLMWYFSWAGSFFSVPPDLLFIKS